MPDDPLSRRLTTIVALDVAGYSARTEADEARTTAEVAALRRVIEGIATAKGGRVFNTAGDGFMLEFGSSLAAVEAALALADKCEPKVRVGVHLGDVVVQPNGDLLGHGVNVAARLMARSDPGSVLVSADVRRTIRGPLAERLVSRGSLQLDKMKEAIEAFALGSAATVNVATAPTSTEPLLAVLPFDNLSDDREMQFFSDGVSEEIIQRLSRGAQMKVIGRMSSFQFRGADKTARNVAKELHCSHILDGSIRRAGGRVRITAHLVEAASQTTLWSDRYDGILEDIFAVQDEISERIAAALDRTFTSFSTKAIDPAVYDLYLHVSPESYAPGELGTNVGLLQNRHAARPQLRRSLGPARLFAGLAALVPALCRSRCERCPSRERSRAGVGSRSAERRRPVGAVLHHPPLRTVRRSRRGRGAYRAGARPGRWRNLRRLALPRHRAASRKRRSDGARLLIGRVEPDVRESGCALENGDGARCGSRAGFRGPHGARARHELPGCEPAARAGLPRGLGGGRPIAGSCGATPPARVSGRAGVHPDQARPHAGERRRHPRRARSALHQDGMRRRLAARVCSASRSGRGSLPGGRGPPA